jgi:hypothetical protein
MVRFALVLALLAGCTQPRSKTCVDICARESDCIAATKEEIPFDEKECVSACEVLRSDQQNEAKVEAHKECVMKNTSCGDVLKCP